MNEPGNLEVHGKRSDIISVFKIRSGFIGPEEGGVLRGVDWLMSEQAKEVDLFPLLSVFGWLILILTWYL